jgi:small basic protein (TIGR04137 family)
MSIHRSLRSKAALVKHRNVLSRVERLKRLEDEGRWIEGRGSVLGLAKVKNIKLKTRKKAKEEAAEAAAPVAGAPAAAPAPGAQPAPAPAAAKTAAAEKTPAARK